MEMLGMYFVVFEMVCAYSSNIDGIDKFIKKVNAKTYKYLEILTKTKPYSLLKKKDVLPQAAPKKCSFLSCLVRKHSVLDDEYIDLLKNIEAYTGYREGAGSVWKSIGKTAEGDSVLSMLLGGVRYSVLTHLSFFHGNFFGIRLPNPHHFLKRFNDEHRIRFYLTYILIRRCVGNIDKRNIPNTEKDMLKIIECIRREDLFDQIKFRHTTSLDDSILRSEEIIKLLAGIDCEKCQLWGRIQFEGIKTALKILKGKTEVPQKQRVFIVNLFMRLSVSVKRNIQLREYKNPLFVAIFSHVLGILCTISVLIIALLLIAKKFMLRKIHSKKR